jgi:hypothetical protein
MNHTFADLLTARVIWGEEGFADCQCLIPSLSAISKSVEIIETGAGRIAEVGVEQRISVLAGCHCSFENMPRDFVITQFVEIPMEVSCVRDTYLENERKTHHAQLLISSTKDTEPLRALALVCSPNLLLRMTP